MKMCNIQTTNGLTLKGMDSLKCIVWRVNMSPVKKQRVQSHALSLAGYGLYYTKLSPALHSLHKCQFLHLQSYTSQCNFFHFHAVFGKSLAR